MPSSRRAKYSGSLIPSLKIDSFKPTFICWPFYGKVGIISIIVHVAILQIVHEDLKQKCSVTNSFLQPFITAVSRVPSQHQAISWKLLTRSCVGLHICARIASSEDKQQGRKPTGQRNHQPEQAKGTKIGKVFRNDARNIHYTSGKGKILCDTQAVEDTTGRGIQHLLYLDSQGIIPCKMKLEQ